MASNLEVDSISKGATTVNTDEIVDNSSNQICKAWVNFNGSGTVAIRDSFNVSSITDNGTGDYTMNFSNNMANINYSFISKANYSNVGNTWHPYAVSKSTNLTSSQTDRGASAEDVSYVETLVFGD